MKIYIIGHSNIDTLEIGIALQSKDDSFSVSPRFTTNNDEVSEYKYFIDKETVNISYKNNSIITITTNDNESNGILYDDYYNNDILCMNLAEFNIMPDKMFNTINDDTDIIVVWVDSSDNVISSDIYEAEYLEKRLKNINYLYFCNESVDAIVADILEYIYGDNDKREQMLEEFS